MHGAAFEGFVFTLHLDLPNQRQSEHFNSSPNSSIFLRIRLVITHSLESCIPTEVQTTPNRTLVGPMIMAVLVSACILFSRSLKIQAPKTIKPTPRAAKTMYLARSLRVVLGILNNCFNKNLRTSLRPRLLRSKALPRTPITRQPDGLKEFYRCQYLS